MSRTHELNRQRATALSRLINAVKSESASAINKALLFYRIPCYSPEDTGKSDSDILYDIHKVQEKIEALKSNPMGAALLKTGKHYLQVTVIKLQNTLSLREQYRKGLVTVEAAYICRSKATDSIVESEPVPAHNFMVSLAKSVLGIR